MQYSEYFLESLEAKRYLEAGEETAKISIRTVTSINTTLHNLEAEQQASSTTLKTQRKDYEDLVDSIHQNFSSLTQSEKLKFKEQVSQKLTAYQKEFMIRQENERNRFDMMVQLVQDRLFVIQMDSINQRLYIISLFNDFCNALFNTVFVRCDTTKVPTINDNFDQVKDKLNNIKLLSTEEISSNHFNRIFVKTPFKK